MGPLETTKPWSMQGVEGISRFLNRAWRMIIDESADSMQLNPKVALKDVAPNAEHLKVLHKTIQSVTQDMESLSFNTATSRLMEFVNYFTAQESRPYICMESFVLLLSPMAPHISEELWQALGHPESLAFASWPAFDPKYIQESMVEIPIQVNGKIRARLKVSADATNSDMEQIALADPRVKKHLKGCSVQKVIVVPKKLVNIVAG
jgi:leucyl-tRNA synthetase